MLRSKILFVLLIALLFYVAPLSVFALDPIGKAITSDLWIGAVINTEEKGFIEAVWQKGGEDTTERGDLVIWGYFYASPSDVSWGSEDNPDLFVKIWFDVSGRIDVNYFHVSVPDIEVYSDYPYDSSVDEQGTTNTDIRYIRHYYENTQSYTSEQNEDGYPANGYLPEGSPSGNLTINNLSIGAMINTEEKGSVDGVWRMGGQGITTRGDQVVWGHFYASPFDVSWGSMDNPDLFVKVWFDASGRVDVNYFHASVPDIEVYSDLPDDGVYEQKGTTIMDDRYIRHEFWINQNIDDDFDGYTLVNGDCDDNDSTIYPGANELCGDGIDQDCNGSDTPCGPSSSFVMSWYYAYTRSGLQTLDGGYIIAGATYSNDGQSYVSLIKTDSSGNETWSKNLSDKRTDFVIDVQQTMDWGYVIVGHTETYTAGKKDVYLIKTDSSGNETWSSPIGGTGNDAAYSVQQTTDGGYVIVGYTESYGAGEEDVYLIKTDSSGNGTWSRTFGGTGNDGGYSVQQTTDGGYVIVGFTESYGAGEDDVYLIKTDSSGNEIWSRTFGGTGNDGGYSVQQTTDEGYIITGRSLNSFGGRYGAYYLIKTNSSGNETWSKTFEGYYPSGYSVQQTTDGGYVIVGSEGAYRSSYGYIKLIKTDSNGN